MYPAGDSLYLSGSYNVPRGGSTLAQYIDLRSDTVTTPTPEMRRAMAEAEVGDDVYGEDPTVNRLEVLAAQIFDKEAALFVPTGTMGNQIAVRLHTQPGQEIIAETRSHVFNYEMAGAATISGCLIRPVTHPLGHPEWSDIEPELAPGIYYRAQTGLITLENSHNFAGGTVRSSRQTEQIAGAAHERGIPVHLDGARIFNVAAALNESVADLCRPVDSVMFCLSKGLCAPVGSMLLGDEGFIERARRVRKLLGGGMRQAGILAAAGLLALEQMPYRLAKDHENAQFLGTALAEMDGFSVDTKRIQTNIVLLDVAHMTAQDLVSEMQARGVLASPADSHQIRLVTHKDVSRKEIDTVIGVMNGLAA